MGKYLDPKDLTKESFERAIQEVMENEEYKKAAKNAKSIIEDTPIKPKDLFLYWINYVIRHKGARHLVSEAPFEMNIFQYLSIDVVMFIACIALILIISVILCVRCTYMFLRKNKDKQE